MHRNGQQFLNRYIPSTHRPTVEEAVEKLNYLRTHGETPLAFTFKRRFTAEEAMKSR